MKRVSTKRSKTSITPSSGNVFAHLQLTNAEEKQTKVRVAVTINQILASASLSQAAASEVLNALGRDVDIVIRKAPGKRAPKIRVTAA